MARRTICISLPEQIAERVDRLSVGLGELTTRNRIIARAVELGLDLVEGELRPVKRESQAAA